MYILSKKILARKIRFASFQGNGIKCKILQDLVRVCIIVIQEDSKPSDLKPEKHGRVEKLETPVVLVDEYKGKGETTQQGVARVGEKVYSEYRTALEDDVSCSQLLFTDCIILCVCVHSAAWSL